MSNPTIPLRSKVEVASGSKGLVEEVYATSVRVKLTSGPAKGETIRVPIGSVTITGEPTKPVEGPRLHKTTKARRRFREVALAAMAKQGITWRDLAEKAGVSLSTLYRFLGERADPRFETTKVSLETLEHVACALEVAPGDFWELD